ncbi:hypothetical protein [Herbidospora cretacea]|uniref:hypothetical protein n=1 Tax=Herbidospora cretacea TaxID=28444 RepID=UPI0012DDC0C7|nr:hypothetical protein [Herbidospora cretacea]
MPTSRSKSLPDDLLPEVHKLAEYINLLFNQLDKSIREYAQEKSMSTRLISRFLRGQEIPPPDFISSLLKAAAAANRRPLSTGEIERAQHLRLEAVRASANAQYEVEDLRAKVEIANAAKEEADERLRTLIDMISALRGEVSLVQQEGKELEDSTELKAIPARKQREIEQRKRDDRAVLVRTQKGIEAEIERLNTDLKEAREAKEKAEKKCQDLEIALKEALRKFAIMGGLIGRPDLELPASIMAYIDDRRIRWGGIIGWCIGPLTVYGLPAYLGVMYQLAFDRATILKTATLIGLIIPVWFAYGIKRLERAGVSRIVHLIYSVAVTAIIFGVTSTLPHILWLS